MSATSRTVLMLALQILLVAAIVGKLLHERDTLPRYWVPVVITSAADPAQPGRIRLLIRLPLAEPPPEDLLRKTRRIHFPEVPIKPRPEGLAWVHFQILPWKGRLAARLLDARPPEVGTAALPGWYVARPPLGPCVLPMEEVSLPLSGTPPDFSRLGPEEVLRLEVNLPPHGPPRPIRLGLWKGFVLRPVE